MTIDSDHEGFLNGLAGACSLVGYLFFDGLTSTTQEKVFGKNPSPSDPFGPDSPVLDQMVSCSPPIATSCSLTSHRRHRSGPTSLRE